MGEAAGLLEAGQGQRGFVCRLLIRASSTHAAGLGNCQEPVSRSDFRKGQTLNSGDGSTPNQGRPRLSSGCLSHREGPCAMRKASEKAGGRGALTSAVGFSDIRAVSY